MNNYRCLVCGYIHTGDAPPENCPICDAPASQFELLEKVVSEAVEQAEVKADSIDSSIKEVLILGSGIAAQTAAETLRDYSKDICITMITNEPVLPYYRLNLTKFLADEVSQGDLGIHDQYWYDDQRIQVYKNRIVTEIDREAQVVRTYDGLEMGYDRLIIALGAHPFIPPIQGISQPGIYTVRSEDEAVALKTQLDHQSRIMILGGGVLGLETAGALGKRCGQVTVAEGAPYLMPRQLNEIGAVYIEKSIKKLGVDVVYDFRTVNIEKSDQGFKVTASDGRMIQTDYIVVATGVRPNTYLARVAGLEVDRGLVVNDFMQTSDEKIYAVGDITEHYGVTYGLWTVAQFQGRIGAMNLLGIRTPFGGVPRSNALKVLDVDMYSVGEISAVDGSYNVLEKQEDDRYICFVLRDQMVVGAIAIGWGETAFGLKKLVESRKYLTADVANNVAHLIAECEG